MKVIPFLAKKPKIVMVPVGNDLTGTVFLLKRGYISPSESPVDYQTLERNRRKFFVAYNARVKELAKERNESIAETRKYLESLQGGEQGDVQIDTGETFMDALDDETLEVMFRLQEDTRTLSIRAATYMLKYRAAIPVILTKNAEAGSRKLSVEPLTNPIGSGDLVRFDDYIVKVRDYANYGSETLMVEDLPIPLTVKSVGYLCDRDTSQIKVGFSDWTTDDTSELIGEELIAQLYQFYQVEAGEAVNENALPEGNEEIVEEMGESLLSSGETYTSDSNISVVPTPV